MSNPWHLRRITLASQDMHKTPAARALALKLVSAMDLLRLKAIARLHARGLPPEVDWSDLLQEAFTRLLDGSRKCPEDVPIVVFLAGVMRSIKADHCRRARRAAARLPQMRTELNLGDDLEGEVGDPGPDPERSLIAMQQLADMYRLFADDPRALQVIEGLFEGWSPEQIRAKYDMSNTEYDSTRKRMRRAFLREGFRWGGHES
jgi:DNA-directed RNA polymerase specialized sigma24 family protein